MNLQDQDQDQGHRPGRSNLKADLTKISVCCGLKFHCMLACRSALKVTLMMRSFTGCIVATWSASWPATAVPPRPDAWWDKDTHMHVMCHSFFRLWYQQLICIIGVQLDALIMINVTSSKHWNYSGETHVLHVVLLQCSLMVSSSKVETMIVIYFRN